jgi:hypothetical protein
MLLCRIDALEPAVRTMLHIAAVLGMEFCAVDASCTYEEMYDIIEPDQIELAEKLSVSFDVLVDEGILERYFASDGEGGDGFDEQQNEEDANLCDMPSCEKSHPFYARRYRFTHGESAVVQYNIHHQRISFSCTYFRLVEEEHPQCDVG